MSHPDDLLYVRLLGKFAAYSFIQGRKLPIVADTYAPRFWYGRRQIDPRARF